jgi:transketolase
MREVTQQDLRTWSEIGHRDVFGQAILELGRQRPDLVVLTADLASATRVSEYGRLFPERFFNVGVAEQNMIGTAAGLALSGKTAFVTTFASFASMRVCEQIRNDLAYQNVSVKVVGIDTGVATANLGVTHFGWEDIAVLRGIPNLVILSPCDGLSVMKLTRLAAGHGGPVYIRLSGGKPVPAVYAEDREFAIGQCATVREGGDVTLIGTGLMVARALEAAGRLQARGISARVLDMYCLKPLDETAVRRAAEETSLIVTVEEHSVIGGLGGAVAEVLAERGNSPRLVRLGLGDRFCHIASHPTLLQRHGLTGDGIFAAVRKNIEKIRGLQETRS